MTGQVSSYTDVEFVEASARLGLTPPVSKEQVLAAYRRQVKRYHPDRFATPAEKGVATRQLQKINAAREYVLLHFARYEARQPVQPPPRVRTPVAADDGRPEIHAWDILERGTWTDILFTPITTVHMIAVGLSFMVALPFLRATRGVQQHKVDQILSLWFLIGPHLATLALFLGAESGGWVKTWFGLAFITMLVAEVIAQVRGATVVAKHRDEVVLAEATLPGESLGSK